MGKPSEETESTRDGCEGSKRLGEFGVGQERPTVASSSAFWGNDCERVPTSEPRVAVCVTALKVERASYLAVLRCKLDSFFICSCCAKS